MKRDKEKIYTGTLTAEESRELRLSGYVIRADGTIIRRMRNNDETR